MACGELPREPEENECAFCASWTPERIKAAKVCPMPEVDTSGRLTFACYPHSAAPKPIVGGIGSPGPSKFLYICSSKGDIFKPLHDRSVKEF